MSFQEWFNAECLAGNQHYSREEVLRAAWDAASARAAAIVKSHDPADEYLTDESGEETPQKASWDSQKDYVASLILDPEHKPPE